MQWQYMVRLPTHGEAAMSAVHMQRVGALDYSLTKCGIAVGTRRVAGGVVVNTTTARSTGHTADTYPMRCARWRQLRDDVLHSVGTCSLVVIEGIVPCKGMLQDRYAARGFILDALVAREIPIAELSPKSAKKAITGDGSADKALMSRHVTGLYPDLQTANEDEVDSAALLHVTLVALGWPVKTLERHKQVKWNEWPEFGPEMRVVS